MEQFLQEVVYWHWFIFAAVMLVLELMISGFFFIWLGAAATSVGLILLVKPSLGWQEQGLIFALLSIIYLIAFKFWRKNHEVDEDNSTLNKRGEQYVGRTLQLKEGLVNGRGRVPVDDSVWQVRTEDESDIAAGVTIEVVDVIRTTLIIKEQVTSEE